MTPGEAVTAGDVSADGRTIVLRTYDRALVWTRRKSDSLAKALAREPCVAGADLAGEGQGEALALAARRPVVLHGRRGQPTAAAPLRPLVVLGREQPGGQPRCAMQQRGPRDRGGAEAVADLVEHVVQHVAVALVDRKLQLAAARPGGC